MSGLPLPMSINTRTFTDNHGTRSRYGGIRSRTVARDPGHQHTTSFLHAPRGRGHVTNPVTNPVTNRRRDHRSRAINVAEGSWGPLPCRADVRGRTRARQDRESAALVGALRGDGRRRWMVCAVSTAGDGVLDPCVADEVEQLAFGAEAGGPTEVQVVIDAPIGRLGVASPTHEPRVVGVTPARSGERSQAG